MPWEGAWHPYSYDCCDGPIILSLRLSGTCHFALAICLNAHCPQKKPRTFWPSPRPSPSIPPAPGNRQSTFCLHIFAYSDISHKWNYTIGGLLWLVLSRNVTFSRFICVVACIGTSFFFIIKEYFTLWICCFLFIYSAVDWHSSHFHFLATLNNAAMNIRVQLFVWSHVLSSLGYIFT